MINKIDIPLPRLTKKKKRKDPNQWNYKWKRRHYNGYYGNSKEQKLPWTTVCQQTGQTKGKGKILRDIPSTKTKPGRNRKSE